MRAGQGWECIPSFVVMEVRRMGSVPLAPRMSLGSGVSAKHSRVIAVGGRLDGECIPSFVVMEVRRKGSAPPGTEDAVGNKASAKHSR